MTALGKLVRTTAFRLTLAYALVFAVIASSVLAYVALERHAGSSSRACARRSTRRSTASSSSISVGGMRRLVVSVEQRSKRPGSSLYLITNFAGEALAGNVARMPASVLTKAGDTPDTPYQRLDDPDDVTHHAYVRVFVLPGGFRLVVGRDLERAEQPRRRHQARFRLALVVLTALRPRRRLHRGAARPRPHRFDDGERQRHHGGRARQAPAARRLE